jgi:hypothetical protein
MRLQPYSLDTSATGTSNKIEALVRNDSMMLKLHKKKVLISLSDRSRCSNLEMNQLSTAGQTEVTAGATSHHCGSTSHQSQNTGQEPFPARDKSHQWDCPLSYIIIDRVLVTGIPNVQVRLRVQTTREVISFLFEIPTFANDDSCILNRAEQSSEFQGTMSG